MTPRPCGVCGADAPAPFRMPAAEGAPDLDLRPGEPARSTLPKWVAACRQCGACAPDLAVLAASLRPVVESEAYRGVGGPARSFLRWAMLCAASGDRDAAAEATLQAAWVLDDKGDDAASLRKRAAALWGEPAEPGLALRLVDVLRRAGAFAEAEARAAALEGRVGEEGERILGFQRRLIAARDAGRHLMSSALRPPARTPHASHGAEARGAEARRPGFWSRLFRR